MALNPNDYAFPVPSDYVGCGGLSTREYFASKAPETPSWFTHKPEPQPQQPRHWHEVELANEEDLNEVRAWESDAIWDLPEHLRWFQDQWAEYWEKYNEWKIKDNITRYFQWRTYYADMMIEELNKTA